MNYEEILAVLKDKIDNVSDFAHGDFNPKELGLGECTKDIFCQGGEGEGETWVRVHHFVDHNVFIKTTGFYTSYNGTDFDGWGCCSQVTPKEKVITIYE
jgi:hypothetical protein